MSTLALVYLVVLQETSLAQATPAAAPAPQASNATAAPRVQAASGFGNLLGGDGDESLAAGFSPKGSGDNLLEFRASERVREPQKAMRLPGNQAP